MGTTTKERLANYTKRRIKELPYHDGEVFYIQSMTEVERAEFNDSLLNKEGEIDQAAAAKAARRLICMCLVEQDGTAVFVPGVDEEKLNNVDAALTMFLREAIDDHCGLRPKTKDIDSPKKS